MIGDMAALTDACHRCRVLARLRCRRAKLRHRISCATCVAMLAFRFTYQDWVFLLLIGHHCAVARFGQDILGFIAWLLWALVHIVLLIGFRNRSRCDESVGMGAYLTRQGSSPLITEHQARGCALGLPAQDPPTRARNNRMRGKDQRRASHKMMTMSGRRTTQPRDERRLQEKIASRRIR